jgi:hypothetical protein
MGNKRVTKVPKWGDFSTLTGKNRHGDATFLEQQGQKPPFPRLFCPQNSSKIAFSAAN